MTKSDEKLRWRRGLGAHESLARSTANRRVPARYRIEWHAGVWRAMVAAGRSTVTLGDFGLFKLAVLVCNEHAFPGHDSRCPTCGRI